MTVTGDTDALKDLLSMLYKFDFWFKYCRAAGAAQR